MICIIESPPGHRTCHRAQSAGLGRVRQGGQGGPGPLGLSAATDPAPIKTWGNGFKLSHAFLRYGSRHTKKITGLVPSTHNKQYVLMSLSPRISDCFLFNNFSFGSCQT